LKSFVQWTIQLKAVVGPVTAELKLLRNELQKMHLATTQPFPLML